MKLFSKLESSDVMANVIKDLDPECFQLVHDSFGCMEALTNGTGCAPYNNASDILPLLRYLFQILLYVVG
jgi:hypothetical protein